MSIEKAAQDLARLGLDKRIRQFDVSSATVDEAAVAVGCEPARIAKTLSFMVDERPVLIVVAGDARIDNRKFKQRFHQKARMLTPQQAEELVGHAVGGVCPFGVNEGVVVWLDESLRRFETVFPACGSGNSAIELSLPELEEASRSSGWIDVGKLPEAL